MFSRFARILPKGKKPNTTDDEDEAAANDAASLTTPVAQALEKHGAFAFSSLEVHARILFDRPQE
jgi:hypothetical protein